SISAPEAFSVGYEFRNWAAGSLTILSGETVTKSQINSKDTFFIAQYGEQESTQYNVTVSGSTQDGVSPYTYNSKVSVSAAGAPAGQSFAYWMRDGKIISYNPSYSFYVWHDTVVEAVYLPAEDIPPALPQTIMDAPKKIGDKAVFAAERTTPAGFEMIESGILLTDNAVNATGSTFNTETPGVIKAIAQSGEPNGQFTARCDDADGTWYARAYMIYINVNTGEHTVVYSNIESI
ncbi:MAG: hypothetical protein GX541_03660, partial [Clostridiales bacterium]|nr:hypothetical protein [Clostridiales bacterium]